MPTSDFMKPNLEVVADAPTLAERLLVRFLEQAAVVLSTQSRFTVAVSGGRTPKRFFTLLGQSDEARELPWEKIHLFWTDERYVARDSEQSNFKLVADTLLPHIPIPVENVHGIPTDAGGPVVDAGAYEDTLRQVFDVRDDIPVLDLVLLGMGADGHTASLFPHTYAPFNREDWVCAVFKSGGDVNRISLTAPVLTAARQLLVVVGGEEKASTLKAVLHGPPDVTHYPIHVLWPVLDKVTWLVDQSAACLLDCV